jgi:hypothetical protein
MKVFHKKGVFFEGFSFSRKRNVLHFMEIVWYSVNSMRSYLPSNDVRKYERYFFLTYERIISAYKRFL